MRRLPILECYACRCHAADTSLDATYYNVQETYRALGARNPHPWCAVIERPGVPEISAMLRRQGFNKWRALEEIDTWEPGDGYVLRLAVWWSDWPADAPFALQGRVHPGDERARLEAWAHLPKPRRAPRRPRPEGDPWAIDPCTCGGCADRVRRRVQPFCQSRA